MLTGRMPGKGIGAAVISVSFWLGGLTPVYARTPPMTESGQAATASTTGEASQHAGKGPGVTEVRGISVHGTDEYPKVLNIVPWQTPTLTRRARPKLKADLGGLLNPVSPRVLERQRQFRKSLHLVNPEQGIE